MVHVVRSNFKTVERRNKILNWWNTVTLAGVQARNPDKSTLGCFEILRKELTERQLSLRPEMPSEDTIRDKIYHTYRGTPETYQALLRPASTF